MNELYAAWLAAKEAEKVAVETRRAIEDQIAAAIAVAPDFEGTKNITDGGYKIKVVYRINHKISGDSLQEIAAEHGSSAWLSTLFRWKPEISASAWKAAPAEITAPLLGAITTTAGRPSFSIEVI